VKILVINAGSSSVKYTVIESDTNESVLTGAVSDIGQPGSVADHVEAFAKVLDSVGDVSAIAGVGHRVVHGGERFVQPVVITTEVENHISTLSALAPLHNPANLAGIRAARAVLPGIPQVAVFDTAFHSTLGPQAHTMAIPQELAKPLGIRKYGFHGTSHGYVSRIASEMLGGNPTEHRVITLHLGNGSSVAAVKGGVCIDTSMGFTPLAGLVMGTRPGDVDPSVITHLLRTTELSLDDVDDLLNTGSGLLALAGTHDFREVTSRALAGDASASLALDVWAWRIHHYIGAYTALLGGLDALVFTGGIGENSAVGRTMATADLTFMGIDLDDVANAVVSSEPRVISSPGTSVTVMVIPTNEELEIARQSAQVLTRAR
jgi:acetate kinase